MRNERFLLKKIIPWLSASALLLAAGGWYASAPVSADADSTVAYTYVLGEQGENTQTVFYYGQSFADGWNSAVARASEISSRGTVVKVRLADDWLATETESEDSTSFGLGEGFENGQIFVPNDVNITLDLNGFFIDRGLSAFDRQADGSVVCVAGKLTVEDGNPTAERLLDDGASFTGGAITGGNAEQGGGVYFGNAFRMEGGSIAHNTAEQGGGVYGKVTVSGGSIAYNTAEQGGGVFGEVTVSGGSIAYNTAEQGGGVYFGNAFRMEGGSIVSNAAEQGGGVYGTGTGLLCGGAVSSNEAVQGGGIYCAGNSELHTSDGSSVAGNAATQAGGGIYIADGGSVAFTENASVTGNAAEQGSGVYQSANAELAIGGNVQIYDNCLYLETDAILKTQTLEDALVHISCEAGVPFTSAYLEYNAAGIDGLYAVSPVDKFIHEDESKKAVVNSDGELVFVDAATHSMAWNIGYGSGESEALPDEYGVTLTYGDDSVTNVSLGGQSWMWGKASNVGEYFMDYSYSDIAVRFTVVILPRELGDEGVSCALAGDTKEFVFTGEQIMPEVTLVYEGEALTEGVDYTLAFTNNLNTGTAQITVNGMGNFDGERILNFTIVPPKDLTYTTSWEALIGGQWEAYTDESFVFNMTDYKTNLRARLTAETLNEFVYYDTPYDQTNWNANLHLVFDKSDVIAAGAYTVEIAGTPNGTVTDRTKTIRINAAALSVREESFSSYEDGQGNRLWQLSGGERLRDAGTVYYDPTAGDAVTGALNDAYARFLGEERELVLNGNYLVDGTPLSSYYPYLTVDYAGSNRATGNGNGAVQVDTAVTLTFDRNFTLSGGSNSLTLHKTWYIVVINNSLVNADGSPVGSAFADVSYGKANSAVFRPEHGSTAIYSIGSLYRFAAVFTENGAEAEYYGVQLSQGEWAVNDSDRLSNDYLNRCLNRLSAGSYTLTVFVPRQDEYYPFTQSFDFRVLPCSLEEDGAFVSGVSYFLLQDRVFYNGAPDNTPKLNFSLDRKTLREGVDYKLLSSSVSVGKAELAVRGIGNYSGTVYLGSEVYEIVQAVNGWTLTPGINPWAVGKYSETENTFYAEARFGNVRFRITLADDESYIIFDTERGIDLLKEAKAGAYVLTAYVADGAKNYSDLSPFMVAFRIFPPAGMPWWGTLLVVVGVLGVLAIVFVILQKKGVLQVLSGKMVIAIRAKAAADATIAAVRANKRAEESARDEEQHKEE